jgi:pyrroline-5-carboxylate reductase
MVIVGAGIMGRALALGMRQGSLAAADMFIVEPNADRGASVAEELGGQHTDLGTALAEPAMILLAVKPQQMTGVLAEIAPLVQPGSLVISIAAGITLERLQSALPDVLVFRAMPNTPARIHRGVVGLSAPDGVAPAMNDSVVDILASVGTVVQVPESQMDALTAISGSGPAYLFYLAEVMLASAQELGLAEPAASTLVAETLAGAAELLRGSGAHPADLRTQVTSPGGTTEAAIETFDADGVRAGLAAGIAAANRRSAELR